MTGDITGDRRCRLRPLTRDGLDEDQADLWDRLLESRSGEIDLHHPDGSLVGPFNAFVHVPRLGRRLLSLGGSLRYRTSIERRLTEIVICTVGAHWRSNFEFWAHAPMAAEHGVDAAVVEALRSGVEPTFERDDERIVHEVTTQLLHDRRVDEVTFAAAETLLGEQGLVELAELIGYYCLISMTLNLFEVPLPDGDEPVWP
jgi:4-carboxymuconolactone decarboxylase